MTRSGQVWSGDIVLDNNSAPLQDITFSVSSSFKLGNRVLLPQNAELAFISYVAPSRIPLYLVAGPSLDVWTDNEATESWFRDFLLGKSGSDGGEEGSTAWWNTHRCQSDVGVLLHVGFRSDGDDWNPRAPGPKITEVLLYGTLSAARNAGRLPTPPASSSPVPSAAVDRGATNNALAATVVKQVTVHALLLSSELAYSEAQAATTGLSAGVPAKTEAASRAFGDPGMVDAQFLPPLSHHKRHGTQPSLKRSRAETLFEDATEKARKARRSGGKGVSRAMADIAGSNCGAFPPPLVTQAVINKVETQNLRPELPVSAGINPANSSRSPREGSAGTKPQSSDSQHNWSSRSGSLNVSGSRESKETDQIRTTSRRNTLKDTKWSSLSPLSTAATGDGESQIPQTGVLEPLKLPEAQRTIEMRNKELLSRIVMAGMRIYGLQQQNKANKLRDVSEGPASIDSRAPPEIDEYKLVYHQTFKGACFAFRRHIAASSLKHDCMRDVVDRLLAVFCNDPLVVTKSGGENDFAFGQGGAEKTLFAPESSQRRNRTTGAGSVAVSTPRVRRRFAGCAGGEPPPLRLLSNMGAESPLMKRDAGSMAACSSPHQETPKRKSI